jgi:hypothetical protein
MVASISASESVPVSICPAGIRSCMGLRSGEREEGLWLAPYAVHVYMYLPTCREKYTIMGRPPIENRKEVLTVRVDPTRLARLKDAAPSLGRAVEEAIDLWLAREKRRQKADPLARPSRPAEDARRALTEGRDDAA